MKLFTNRQELSELITSTMNEHGISMLDAMVHICEHYNVEEEVVAAYVRQSHKLKEQLRDEATQLKMLK